MLKWLTITINKIKQNKNIFIPHQLTVDTCNAKWNKKMCECLFLAPKPKDPGPNTCGLVDWAWFTTANGLFTNQVVHRARILQHVYTSKQEYIYIYIY